MRVVNVRFERCTHYVGRLGSFKSDGQMGEFVNLGNPFGMAHPWGKKNIREAIIDSFEKWARARPEVLKRIGALPEDAVLGCWCKPLACHGDVVAKIWKELHGKD